MDSSMNIQSLKPLFHMIMSKKGGNKMIGLLKKDNLLYKIGPDKHDKKDNEHLFLSLKNYKVFTSTTSNLSSKLSILSIT